jgi:hypothetical protein
MRILLVGLFALLSACAGGGPNGLANATQQAVPAGYAVSGEYTGTYTCPQGNTDLDLKILSNPNSPDLQYAIFTFGPPNSDLINDPQGSFLMSGRAGPSEGLELQPVSWIKEPLFYTMVPMSGMSADGGASFTGTIDSTGCGNFQLSNIAGASSSPYQAWFAAAPQLTSAQTGTILSDLRSKDITISPDVFGQYITDYMKINAAGSTSGNTADAETFIEQAEPYREKGLTVDQAVYYSTNNIAYDDIATFNASKQQYDANKAAALQQCGGNVSYDDITQLSPYSIEGRCFEISATRISQWLNQGSALVADFGLLLDFPNTQQTNTFYNILVIGEGPYSYQAASGAALTIPRAQVLVYLNETLEIPAPPGPTK